MVELVEQNFTENKEKYNNVEKVLKTALGTQVPIDHVGSTAIPNMVGKNIIDVLVGAKDAQQFSQFLEVISNLGYLPSQNSKSEIYQFFASHSGETSSGDTHIHLVIMNTERYSEFLVLRDYLLANPDVATQYSNHKKMLLQKGITNRKEYRNTKSEFVTQLIKQAKEYKLKNKQ